MVFSDDLNNFHDESIQSSLSDGALLTAFCEAVTMVSGARLAGGGVSVLCVGPTAPVGPPAMVVTGDAGGGAGAGCSQALSATNPATASMLERGNAFIECPNDKNLT